jgi:hypothetical protein
VEEELASRIAGGAVTGSFEYERAIQRKSRRTRCQTASYPFGDARLPFLRSPPLIRSSGRGARPRGFIDSNDSRRSRRSWVRRLQLVGVPSEVDVGHEMGHGPTRSPADLRRDQFREFA